MDFSHALVYYGSKYDKRREYISPTKFCEIFNVYLGLNKNKKKAICIIWDNSFYSFSLATIARFLGIKIIYYYHEPGGLTHKLELRAPIYRISIQRLAEILNFKIADYVAVSKLEKIEKDFVFLPLLYDDRRPKKIRNSNKIGYIGALKSERLPELFKSLECLFNEKKYELIFFPSKEYGSTREDKYKFLAECAAIWNVFAYPYILSGVTGDAFFSRTPLIVSKYEPFMDLLLKNDLAVRVDPAMSPKTICEQIIKSIRAFNPSISKSSNRDLSSFGGKKAFQVNWLKTFEAIIRKKY
ncbi:hypothetical protein [Candidatus Methylopumilus planktonicus]|uniref:hypothetical protein n=1 Tax=Candidatus Methylopumilus planktonicus TaxID=1581557 RepID=UPI003BEED2FA